MTRDLFFTLNTLAAQRGGLSKAVIKRANAIITADPERNVTLVTLGIQPNLEAIREEIVEARLLDPRIQVVNVINFLARRQADKRSVVSSKAELIPRWEKRYTLFLDASRAEKDSYRLFDNGTYVQYARFDANNQLSFIDYFSENRHRLRREEYLDNGQLVQTIQYSLTSNKPVSRSFFHSDGTCYLTIWHKINSADWSHLFYFEAGQEKQFNDPAIFNTFVLNKLLDQHDAVLISSEYRDRLANLPKKNLDAVILDIKHPNIKKIAFGHSNHFVSPFNETAAVSGVWDTLFGRIDEWDRVITATPRQQAHMTNQFGHPETFHAIPHGVGAVPEADYSVLPEPDPNRFIVVSRIQVKKDVAASVRVMRKIVDHHPNAFLDFYGFGYNDQLEKDLHALIKELSLTKHIRFKGFVTNIQDAYHGAVATIFTSQSEGFGMAILESMGYGVPVIAYDVCYGPREIIEHGTTGFIIPTGDTSAFAAAAIRLMEQPSLRRQMGEAALHSVERFSDDLFTKNWLMLLNQLDE